MTYTTGTTGTTALASTMRGLLETQLTANGWTLVDDFTDVTGTPANLNTRTWKNPAANNRSGIDFFVGLGYVVGTDTVLYLGMGETYDATLHQVSRHVIPSNNNSAGAVRVDGSHQMGPYKWNDGRATAGVQGPLLSQATVVASLPYAMWVDEHGFYLSVNTTGSVVLCARACTKRNSHASEVGLISGHIASVSSTQVSGFTGGFTRLPAGGSPTASLFATSFGQDGVNPSTADPLMGGLARGTKIVLYDNRVTAAVLGGTANANALRVELDRILAVPVAASSPADTMTATVDGVPQTHRILAGMAWVQV